MWKVLVSLVLLIPAAVHTETISLREAMVHATHHNLEVLAARRQAVIAGQDVLREATAFHWVFQPSVVAESRGGHRDSRRVGATVSRRLGATGGQVSGTGQVEWLDDKRFDRVELSLTQPLFRRFGRQVSEADLSAATAREKIAMLDVDRFIAGMMLRVVRVFTECKLRSAQQEVESDALVRAHELARLVGLRQQQGRASSLERLEVEMLRREQEIRVRDAEDQLQDNLSRLSLLLGRDRMEVGGLGGVGELSFVVPPESVAVSMAMSNRPERAIALIRYEEALRELRLDERRRYPDVSVITRWRPIRDDGSDSWFLGLSGRGGADREQSRLEVETSEELVGLALNRIATLDLELQNEVRDAKRRIQQADRNAELNRLQYEMAGKRLKTANAMYRRQRVDVLVVREAQESLSLSGRAKLESEVECLRARYQFLYALGLLVQGGGLSQLAIEPAAGNRLPVPEQSAELR